MKSFIGTVSVAVALLAGAGHMAMGNVNVDLLGWLLMGSLPGVWMGSHLTARVPHDVLRLIIAAVLAIVGIKALLS